MKNLFWLAVVALGTAAFMVWKGRHTDEMSMDLLYTQYKALGAGIGALLVGLVALNWSGFWTGAHRVWVIGVKELFGYFASPLGYIIFFDFLIIVGYMFYYLITMDGMTVNFYGNPYWFWLFFVTMLTVPMMTMRLFAEEKASGTIEMLVTAPITETQIVLGKYLAAAAFYLCTLAPTGIYVVLLRKFASPAVPEMGTIFTVYLGIFLMAAIFLSIGTFISALTKHQVVAGMLTLHVLLILWLVLHIATWKPWQVDEKSWWTYLYSCLNYAHFEHHMEPFVKGLISSSGFVYAFSLVIFFLFLTTKTLEVRRWK